MNKYVYVGYVSRDTSLIIRPLERSPLKCTYSWRDKLILLLILNRQAKIFLHIQHFLSCLIYKGVCSCSADLLDKQYEMLK